MNKIEALIALLLSENKLLRKQIAASDNAKDFKEVMLRWIMDYIRGRSFLERACLSAEITKRDFDRLNWKDVAALRMYDYLNHAGIKVDDPSISKGVVISDPFGQLFDAVKHNIMEFRVDFMMDMIMLFRQFNGSLRKSVPGREKVMEWISRHPSGIDPEIVAIRNQNRDRIIRKFIAMIDDGRINDAKFTFGDDMTNEEKYALMLKWWQTRLFHLRFAIRDPEVLNEMLDYSISEQRMKQLRK
ncbi:MAG TPA: hypothetical protein VK994_02040, partial [Bacteroidales bacterium]|nr:hypothetical protein [Bacteroidales bacterium]